MTKQIFLSQETLDYAEKLGYTVKHITDFNYQPDPDTVTSELRSPQGIHVYITRSPGSMGFYYGLWEVSLHNKNFDYFVRDNQISLALSEEALKWLLRDTARGDYAFQRKRKHWFDEETDYDRQAEILEEQIDDMTSFDDEDWSRYDD